VGELSDLPVKVKNVSTGSTKDEVGVHYLSGKFYLVIITFILSSIIGYF
jgi:hypothetical protein